MTHGLNLAQALVTLNAGAKRTTITPERRKELYTLKRLGIEYGLSTGEVKPNGVHCGLQSYVAGTHKLHLPVEGAKIERRKLSETGPRLPVSKRRVYHASRYLRQLIIDWEGYGHTER